MGNKTAEKTREELTKIDMNEQNIRVLLQTVLSIMTDEQLKILKKKLDELETDAEAKKKSALKSYLN